MPSTIGPALLSVVHAVGWACCWALAVVLTPHARAEQLLQDQVGDTAFGATVHQIKTLAGLDDRLTIQRVDPPNAIDAFVPPGWAWVQGVAVYGSSPGQGDFSGVEARLRADGGLDVLVISDSGYWLAGHWDPKTADQGPPLVLSKPLSLETRPGARPGESQDNPEALALDRDGTILVGFEGDHRVQRHQSAVDRPSVLPVPTALRSAFRNRGIETLVVLPDGRYLALSEGVDRQGGLRGWVFHADDPDWPTLVYPKEMEDGFAWRPTAAAVLDDRLLVVERWWDGAFGVRTRLVQLPLTSIEPGAQLAPMLLFETTPLAGAFGNVEGLTTLKDGNQWLVVLVTDNQEIALLPSVFLALAYQANAE